MEPTLRYVEAWLSASIMTTVFASLISSIRVLTALKDIGMQADIHKVMSMLSYDLIHFAPGYAIFIMISLGLAFVAAWMLGPRAPVLRVWLYMFASFIAIVVMLVFMQRVFFGVPFIAGARDGLGVILQGACGSVGGLIYYILAHKTDARIVKVSWS